MTFVDATRDEYTVFLKLYADRSKDKTVHMRSRFMVVHSDTSGKRIASAVYARGLVPMYRILDELWNQD